MNTGSVSGSRTTAGYLRGVFAVDQLEWQSPTNPTNSNGSSTNSGSGKAQQQQQQPGRGSSEQQQRGGAQAKKWELEGHIKKRLSWLNTQQVPPQFLSELLVTHFERRLAQRRRWRGTQRWGGAW